MSARTPVFSQTSLERLRERGEDTTVRNGSRVLSQRSIGTSSSSSSTSTISIPEILESKETLMFMGFNDDVATAIHNRWRALEAEFGYELDFYERIKTHIDRHCYDKDPCGAGISYRDAFVSRGFTSEACDRLCKPSLEEFKDRFSAGDFTSMAVECSWMFLKECDSSLRLQMPSHLLSSEGPRDMFFDHAGPFTGKTAITALSDLSGHKLLYKGALPGRLKRVFRNNGKLDLGLTLYQRPGDFYDRVVAYHFTDQRDTALWFARLRSEVKADAREYSPSAILICAVPDKVFGSMKSISGTEWQKTVWNSHHRDKQDKVPESIPLQEYDWVHGAICATGPPGTEKMSSWREVRPHRLGSGIVARQYGGRHDMSHCLDEKCAGKVWLTIV